MEEKKSTKKLTQTKTQKEVEIELQKEGVVFEEKDLKITVEQIQDHSELEIIGGCATYIAFKNLTSYAIGTDRSGLKVIKEGAEIYSKRFLSSARLDGIIYINSLNCYLLYLRSRIYRKDIDNKPPYLYMKLYLGSRSSNSIKYSKIHNRLILAKYLNNNLALINLERKRIELEIRRVDGSTIQDLKIVGPKESQIATIARNGRIELFSLTFNLKRVVRSYRHQVKLLSSEFECGQTVAVCEKNKFLLAGFSNSAFDTVTRIIAFGIGNRSLTQLHSLDKQALGLHTQLVLESWKTVGSHIVWVALCRFNKYVNIYDLDTKTGKLKELLHERIRHQKFLARGLHRFGDSLYCASDLGRIMRVKISI